jgi:hypothetical protein
VADLLAIIAPDPQEKASQVELDQLLASYEGLRGKPERQLHATGERACAYLLGRDTATSGVEGEGEGDGWTAWAGSLCPNPAAMAGPLEQLDGQFALLRQRQDGRVHLAIDPLGMKPLFVARRGGLVYAATSALVLARHLRLAPSRLGLEAFLRGGLQFGRWTEWEGVERLQPAQALEFGPDGGTARTYWQPAREETLARLPLAEAAALCIERARAAIAERYGGLRPWIDLTGGFDSRLLGLLVADAGIEPMANTVGTEDEEDVRIARRLALAKGWPWTRIGLPGDWAERLPEEAAAAVAWGDGHLDALQLAEVLLGHREKAELEMLLLNGGGGEEFRDHPWGHELFAAGRSSKVGYERLIAWRILLAVDLSPLREDPSERVTALFREELEARAQPFATEPNSFQDDLLYALKMTGHSGAYQAAGGASMDVEVPFYLKPILGTVTSFSLGNRRFHRLMREMMRQLDPAAAALPTETGGPAEPLRAGNLPRFAPYAWRRARRFAHRARGRLGERTGPEPPPGPSEAARTALVDSMRRQGRLNPAQMRTGPLYDPERLDALLDRAAAHPMAVDWAAVGRIVTLELALEAADAGL